MKNVIKKTFRALLFFALAFSGLIICYLILAISTSLIPANSNYNGSNEGIEIYIFTNGVHTDIALPSKNEIYDWNEILSFSNIYNPSNSKYVSFGWGNKDFYLKCKTWGDLKFTTAFNAAFGLSSSLMHVSCYDNFSESKSCIKVLVSKNQYKQLIRELENTFQKSTIGKPIEIAGSNYYDNDAFFEANGNYHLFNTCNSWANSVLKKIGLKTAVWTPFDKGIFYHLR